MSLDILRRWRGLADRLPHAVHEPGRDCPACDLGREIRVEIGKELNAAVAIGRVER